LPLSDLTQAATSRYYFQNPARHKAAGFLMIDTALKALLKTSQTNFKVRTEV
jgi:hypothetical protein